MQMMVTRTMSRCNGILGVVLLLSPLLRLVDASVYVDVPFAERVFDSVPYFNFEDTRWPYVSVGDMLVGPISVLAPTDFDNFFMEYQQSGYAQEESQTSPSDTSSASPAPTSINPIGENQMFTPTPSFLLVEFGASVYSSSVENIRRVAKWLEADFVILMVNRNSSWQDKFSFWWTQQFPGIPSELFDNEGKISTKLGQCAFMGMGPKQGEEMMSMMTRFEEWRVSGGSQEFYFGIDGLTIMTGQGFATRLGLYLSAIFLFWRWASMMDRREQHQRLGADSLVKYTGEDLGMGEVQASSSQHECCVCLEAMPHGEQVRILPCRHVFHHQCINGWFEQHKFTCPMCKMDLRKHLAERRIVSAELGMTTAPPRRTWRQRLWPWGRKIGSLNADQLIDIRTADDGVGGDLELTEGSGVIV